MRWLPAKTATQEGRKGGFSGAFLPVRARSSRLFWKLFREKGAVFKQKGRAVFKGNYSFTYFNPHR